ncbi:autotransporter outer membrane beta-barrel domain-containing protein [Snodgrassella sp. ESL0304]|uniref:autotransporter outer membrane beta-barrel domain-containing protein n=1 Tax=Snodgrassella sp. ESL0304 TaxID=2705032 RepID=UPI0015839552|nr:autotransporter outer membrane beta-barrel domain-containing protein [Snodgrassella sp. ESL0304]NUE81007.1 autotransporter outer membrane beta-barrel domain-containing protein [Snodgrassella sp. ESL0304]
MNNIYKSKWSEATQTWVACSELVRGKTKNNCAKIAAAVALAMISINSYAADCVTTTANGAANPNINVSGSTCNVDGSINYATISAKKSSEITGKDITAVGSPVSAATEKVINITGNSSLTADNITTTNNKKNNQSSALLVNNSSTVTVHHDLNATNTNTGTSAQIISVKNGSTLDVANDITITDEGGASDAGILNDHSSITANNITITGNKDVVKGTSAIINNGGTIEADTVTINQGGKNSAIQQIQELSDDDDDDDNSSNKNPEIHIKKDLNITTYAPESNASAIDIQSGTITVDGNTTINMSTNSNNKNPSVINVGGGTYTTNGDTTITVTDKDTGEENTTTTGIILTDNGTFNNNVGNLTVNGGKNSVIASDQSAIGSVAFNNGKTATTSSQVDTVVHNGGGIFTIDNKGTLESAPLLSENKDKYSVIRNKANGTVIVTNTGTDTGPGTLSGNVNNDSSGKINITNGYDLINVDYNEDSTEDSINEIIKNNDSLINNGSINNNAGGDIIITNNKNINSSINNNNGNITVDNNETIFVIKDKTEDKIVYKEAIINGDITNTNGIMTVNNNKAHSVINGNITNTKDGNITVNNKNSASTITGNITNQDNGTVTINNSGKIQNDNTRNKIENSGTGLIDITNTDTGTIDSDILNKNNGIVTINNSGKANSSKITNSNAGKITLDNKGTVNSTITNQNTGAIKITNDNTLVGSITNTGSKVNKNDPDNIWIDNNKDLNSTINNDGSGTIVVNNNEASSVINGDITNTQSGTITVNNKDSASTITGNITNTKDGNITLDNKGTFDGYIKNKGTGSLSLTNDNTVSGYIENNGTGRISITNDGTINGSITNTGTQRVVGNNWIDNIWIDNNKELKSNIENLNGSIVVNNNKEGSSFTGNIYNNNGFNTGKITVNNNEENTKINSHITNDNGDITINNKAKTSTIEGDITNINGSVKIKNSGEANYSKITNSGGHLNIDNEHEGNFQGDIDNDATGTGIIFIHNYGNTFNGSITNQNTGNIRIINDKIFNSTITNTGDISTVDKYNIKITNNKELTGSIENNGTGSIYIENTKDTGRISRIRRITGNITNNNAGTITLNNDGEIASAILNGGAGAINIENNKDSFINGNITNSGAGNISIKNQDKAVLNGNIKNDGSGSITFTNNGDVDASVVNNTSVRINDTSLRQIQNTGNGTITIINNKTLNRPISNASDGTIGITNNGIMKTDITNTKSSTGEIEFINTQEFEGNLINANTGFISALNTKNFTGITDNSDSGKINLDNQGIWNNTGNSVLTKLQNTTGTIIFPKVSEVNAGDKDQYHTITVNGNYTGGGLMRVNTVWNKDGTSYSDRVDIHGDVDGAATTVQTLNGIYGDVTLKEIPIHSAVVVHVAGKSSGNDFTGSAPTTNAGEAQLKKIDTTSGTDYAWTLTAQNKTPEPTNPGVSGPTDPNISEPTAPDKPILPAPPITEVPIYAEPVSGYVQMPTADMELGFTTIGTLHERRGENQTYNITGSNNTALGSDQQQTWGRVLVKHLDKDGKKRLNTAGNQSVLQIGHDFILDENEKTGIRRHIGGYVAYGHNENDFRDQYRAKNGYIVDDHYTGKGRTDAVSVGGYGTFYGNNGGYVDLVGQVTYLRNKYNARSNESVHQNGWGAALSAETGKSFIVYGNNWFVEPQAQLVYQYLSLDDFNDRIRHVDQHDPSALRGRVGMRFGYNGDTRDNLPSSSFYGIANIWHDFVNPKSVDIGRDKLKEDYAKTWGEVGLGIQLPITRQSNFYSDIRYEKNFGSDKRKGFKGTMGYKYTWL